LRETDLKALSTTGNVGLTLPENSLMRPDGRYAHVIPVASSLAHSYGLDLTDRATTRHRRTSGEQVERRTYVATPMIDFPVTRFWDRETAIPTEHQQLS